MAEEINKSDVYRVYTDEAGYTMYYNDRNQPVLTLAGIITRADEESFKQKVISLFKKYGIKQKSEIHTRELIGGYPPFDSLSPEKRQEFLIDFLSQGVEFIDYIHYQNPLKPFIQTKKREDFKKRNLDIYLYNLFTYITGLDLYFYKKLKAHYKLIFDRTSSFNKRIKKMIDVLSTKSDIYYSLNMLIGEPMQMDSNDSIFIQLADAACFVLTRYRQFEVGTFIKSPNLEKYEDFYKRCFDIVKPKIMDVTSLMLELIRTGEKIWENLGWGTRDFNHVGPKWLTKKKNEDKFDPEISTYWGHTHERMKELNDRLEMILRNNKKIPSIILRSWLKIFRLEIEELIDTEQGIESDFPEITRNLELIKYYEKNPNGDHRIKLILPNSFSETNQPYRLIKLAGHYHIISHLSTKFETTINVIIGSMIFFAIKTSQSELMSNVVYEKRYFLECRMLKPLLTSASV